MLIIDLKMEKSCILLRPSKILYLPLVPAILSSLLELIAPPTEVLQIRNVPRWKAGINRNFLRCDTIISDKKCHR